MTRRLALALAFLAASAAAAPAQSTEELRLPERMDRALRDMMESLEPALDEMLESLGPMLEEMREYMSRFEVIDDPRHYEMPEVLPNGDIIIRRRDDAPPFDPDAPEREATPEPEPEPEAEPEPEGGIRT